jgi:hypothetical protein
MLLHNDAVLAHFGGTWDAPPRLPEGWESESGLPDRAAALHSLAAAYPDPGPAVWKDPRACLLLPYWRDVLDAPVAAVLVWRDPLAVARSLRRRDDMPLPYGVALWERYNRSAIANLAHSDVYVLDYDALIEDPATSLSGLTSWLGATGTFDGMPPLDLERAVAVVTAGLRHESTRTADDEENHIVLDEQRRLVEQLTELAGGHRGLPSATGDESPWTQAVLDVRHAANVLELRKLERRLEHSDAERDWFASALEDARSQVASLEDARADLARLRASSSWRLTAPIRSVVARSASLRERRAKG